MKKIENFPGVVGQRKLAGTSVAFAKYTQCLCLEYSGERWRFTFTPNGKLEFVPRNQVFLLIVVYCLLLLLKNK